MKKYFLIFSIFLFFGYLFGNDNQILEFIRMKNFEQAKNLLENNRGNNVELWRELGYFYKENGDKQNAIYCYEKILKFIPEDYDARLALARLYFQNKQIDFSEKYFKMILKNDKTDVEAYLGLARIQKEKENYVKSINFYNLALKFLPKNIPILFELADVYIFLDQLEKAIKTYQSILEIDDTWSEAWSGIGKMYWWKNKPFLAIYNYRKAIKLDPGNNEIYRELVNIQQELNWDIKANFFLQNETEDNYKIKSFNQKYSVRKRLSDKIMLQVNSFWQYADKDENNSITKRYYDSSYLKTNYQISEKNKLNFTIGNSFTDSTLSVIDAGWELNTNFKEIKILNNLNFGNEYFYYWEKVRRDYLIENLQIKYGKIKFQSNYQIGEVEKNYVLNKTDIQKNIFVNYAFSASYQVSKSPSLSFGAIYKFMDYQYDSSLYYSPINRAIYGLTTSFYFPYKNFYFYSDGSVNQDNNKIFETNFDYEIGFTFKKISLSLGYSDFKNKYYESNSLSLILGGSF